MSKKRKKHKPKKRPKIEAEVSKKTSRYLPWSLFAVLVLGVTGYCFLTPAQSKAELVSTKEDFNDPSIFINSVPVNIPKSQASSHLTKNDFEWAIRVTMKVKLQEC